MKDINLSDETIIRLYKNAGFRVCNEDTGHLVAIILPVPDASAEAFAAVVRRAITPPPSVLCPDGEIISQDDSAEKIDAIKRVLRQRIGAVNKVQESCERKGYNSAYYKGKADGYAQAIDLLGESLKSIKVELENPEE